MKYLLIILLTCNLSAQTIWYVNRDATGSNNGTSWANAWTNPSNINWNSISAGDTIYISGGTDSTTYIPGNVYGFTFGTTSGSTPNWTFANGDPVVVTRAWHSGHNGNVNFVINHNTNHRTILGVGNISNLKIVGLNFYDKRPDAEVSAMLIQLGNGDWGNVDSLIYFENNLVENSGQSPMIYISGCKNTLRGNYIHQLMNSLANDNDAIGMSTGRGGHTIDRNVIIMRNDNMETDAHRDAIQISNIGDHTRDARHTITISNNLIVEPVVNGVMWNNLIYNYNGLGEGDNNIRLLIYNNILVARKVHTSIGGIAVGRYDRSRMISLYILNNTLILKGSGGTGSTPFTSWTTDTLVIKNNIVVSDTTPNIFLNMDDPAYGYYRDIDYNHYARYGGISGSTNFTVAQVTLTWSQWTNQGFDTHSSTSANTAVTFADKYGIEKEDYYTQTGRSAGQNLWNQFPFLRTDALGNPRPETGAWDIGALQYISGTADTIPSFSFSPVTNANLNQEYIASSSFTGADSTFHVWTTTGAEFKINEGSYSTTMKTAVNNDIVYVKNTSSNSYSTLNRETIIAGGVSRNFDVTTKAEPPPIPENVGMMRQSNGRAVYSKEGKIIYTK